MLDTEQAVKAFQRAHGLTVDGIVGPHTWSALGAGSEPDRTGGHHLGDGVRAYLTGPHGARVGAAVGDEHRWPGGNSWTATEHGMIISRAELGQAFGVARGIYTTWSKAKRERGPWGLPISDEHADNGVTWQFVDKGLVTWGPRHRGARRRPRSRCRMAQPRRHQTWRLRRRPRLEPVTPLVVRPTRKR